MFQRAGEIVLRLCTNVQQETIKPLIEKYIAPGTQTYTDEYDIYNRLKEWGYPHETVCHSKGEYARDDDGDGFCEIHCNTGEGCWSLLRSWLRPHRGISQEHLPKYLAFFQYIYNAKRRGKAVLDALLTTILSPAPQNTI